jgi:hypothetical protein
MLPKAVNHKRYTSWYTALESLCSVDPEHSGRANFLRSIPDTSVTVHTGRRGSTVGWGESCALSSLNRTVALVVPRSWA